MATITIVVPGSGILLVLFGGLVFRWWGFAGTRPKFRDEDEIDVNIGPLMRIVCGVFGAGLLVFGIVCVLRWMHRPFG